MEPANSNATLNMDSSWKVPTSGQFLMRASQVCSEFQEGDHSYLRLSLGQFFGQRSEALGCLGHTDEVDVIKRVSNPAKLSLHRLSVDQKCIYVTFSLHCSL